MGEPALDVVGAGQLGAARPAAPAQARYSNVPGADLLVSSALQHDLQSATTIQAQAVTCSLQCCAPVMAAYLPRTAEDST